MVLKSLRGRGTATIHTMALASFWGNMGVRLRFRVIDTFFNFFLFTPLIVLFQVGTNSLLDKALYPYLSPWVCTGVTLGLGITIEFVAGFGQTTLARVFPATNPDDAKFVVATRLYMYALGAANVLHYRGLSDIFYAIVGFELFPTIQTVTSVTIALWGLRVGRNVVAAPLGLCTDSAVDDWWGANTFFKTQTNTKGKNLLDNLATAAMVLSLTNLHWISLWALYDLVIFPNKVGTSIIASWVIGYAIVTLTLLLESRASQLSRHLDKAGGRKAGKTLMEDAYLTLANAGAILIWRGHWMFFEVLAYYFPIFHNGVDITCVYMHLVAFALMCLSYTACMMGGKGCDLDGSFDDGEGVQFSIAYFGEFFKQEIEQQALSEAAAKNKLPPSSSSTTTTSSTSFFNNNLGKAVADAARYSPRLQKKLQ